MNKIALWMTEQVRLLKTCTSLRLRVALCGGLLAGYMLIHTQDNTSTMLLHDHALQACPVQVGVNGRQAFDIKCLLTCSHIAICGKQNIQDPGPLVISSWYLRPSYKIVTRTTVKVYH